MTPQDLALVSFLCTGLAVVAVGLPLVAVALTRGVLK